MKVSIDKRKENMEYMKRIGEEMKLEGKFIGEEGKKNGSIVVVEEEEKEEEEKIEERENYEIEGMLKDVKVRKWKWEIKKNVKD